MPDNKILEEKSYRFAVDAVKLCKNIKESKKEFCITNQLVRSGTSIGANVKEAVYAQRKKNLFQNYIPH